MLLSSAERASAREKAAQKDRADRQEAANADHEAKDRVQAQLDQLDREHAQGLAELQEQRKELDRILDLADENAFQRVQELNNAIYDANQTLSLVDLGQDVVDVGSLFVPGDGWVKAGVFAIGFINSALRPGGLAPGTTAANTSAAGVGAVSQSARPVFKAALGVASGGANVASAVLSVAQKFALAGYDRGSVQRLLGELEQADPTFLQEQFGFDKTALQDAAAEADDALRDAELARERRDAKNQEIDKFIFDGRANYHRVAIEEFQEAWVITQRKYGLPTE